MTRTRSIPIRIHPETKKKLDEIARKMRENAFIIYRKTPKRIPYNNIINAVIDPRYNESPIVIDDRKLIALMKKRRTKI